MRSCQKLLAVVGKEVLVQVVGIRVGDRAYQNLRRVLTRGSDVERRMNGMACLEQYQTTLEDAPA
ncbi:hypothetical protein D769_21434 [Cupriavidus sp. HMR-1]|nr:hypothetical protein D769_21434 [Cupriavidus sp. HMR-1]HBD38754.1 hypothetical protein [Cupriavidus sp.]HBO82325.1 hypothetical protein [Cupriavidus sp.]